MTTLGRSVGRRDRGERGARGNREPNSSDGDGRRARRVEVCRGAGGRRLPRSNTKSRSRVRYRAGRGLRQASEGGASSSPDRARANRISNASDPNAVRFTRRWGFKNVVFVSSRRASIDAGREKRKQRHGDGESDKKKIRRWHLQNEGESPRLTRRSRVCASSSPQSPRLRPDGALRGRHVSRGAGFASRHIAPPRGHPRASRLDRPSLGRRLSSRVSRSRAAGRPRRVARVRPIRARSGRSRKTQGKNKMSALAVTTPPLGGRAERARGATRLRPRERRERAALGRSLDAARRATRARRRRPGASRRRARAGFGGRRRAPSRARAGRVVIIRRRAIPSPSS